MQATTKLYLDPFREYLNFLEKCKNKKYPNSVVLHNHHIYPKFIIENDKEYLKKTIKLSVDDHITAHFLLSKCFDEGSREQVGNLRACKLLSKNSIKLKEELKKIYESQKGQNNPSKKLENRKKISQGLKEFYLDNYSEKKGKTYEEIYGEARAYKEKLKRKKTTRTPEQYRQGALKAAKKNKGKPSHNSICITIEGKTFRSIKKASEYFGITPYKIKQLYYNNENN